MSSNQPSTRNGTRVEIWTDGSITGNGKADSIGGWACILRLLDVNGSCLREKRLSGALRGTTNNEMELTAIFMGLCNMRLQPADPMPVHICTDSEYCINAIRSADKWAFEGWKPRPNIQLIRAIHSLCQDLNIHWNWVRGHIGVEFNELADEMAKAARIEEANDEQRYTS